MPGARCTHSLACRMGSKHTSIFTTGTPESPGIPARNGFNGLLRALPGDRAFLSPSSALLLADLTPASRRQDHTTLPSAATSLVSTLSDRSRQTRLRSHRALKRCRVHCIPHPTSVTIAKRPSVWGGMARISELIWVQREGKYFCKWDWTGKITSAPLICPSG
jgi:hypothetical protein